MGGLTRPRAGERGSQAVELVLFAPVLLLVIGLLAAGGRLALAANALESAAAVAAREATLAGSGTEARRRAEQAAGLAMEQSGYPCRTVEAEVSGQAGPGGSDVVRVEIVCALPVGDLGLPGLEGAPRLRASAQSPDDPHREPGCASCGSPEGLSDPPPSADLTRSGRTVRSGRAPGERFPGGRPATEGGGPCHAS